ncbi:TetR/AcrR family transcriptional regulator [Pseudonocardia humida]|uniref:TetR/AcrR family transcriptional regulator n=1 Tax=Pseudonocardia humida TaxID=2800819 RepID=A0ABT0ZZT0_9PSEU|nr:TetR/AcrR family transcriptional regulator [Pseudonocardia humida]MCO1656263.1 TetR/AcrR family transcriptional regulator [Pseudonocardia humida]
MARWEPNASRRLMAAALDLFEEHGYDNTTVTGIAERAGLAKSTFFRHYADKREVLFDDDTLAALLVEGIGAAPEGATALDALAHAFDRTGRAVFTNDRREFSARRIAVIAAAPELQERDALKERGLIAAMVDALERRGVPDLTARVAAELGALAFRVAYERWGDPAARDDFDQVLRRALVDVRDAGALC